MTRPLPDRLAERLADLGAAPELAVALSGGLDSSVLLHALAGLAPRLGLRLRAVHVDHGLHPDSAAWATHCRELCATLGVPLASLRVDAAPQAGQSPEAAAREARHAALREWLPAGVDLLMAHHRGDQAETLLLRLLRGAGPEGLAAMASARPFGRGRLLRPLLDVPRAGLRAYAGRHALGWIEDPSNADPAFDRNYLRTVLWPLIEARWPGAERSLARAAELQAEAAGLVAERGRALLHGLADPHAPARLAIDDLSRLPRAERHRLLRAWLRSLGLPLPDRAGLARVDTELIDAGADRQPRLAWPGAELRRHAGHLHAMAPLSGPPPMPPGGWRWDRPDRALEIAGLGVLEAVTAPGGLDPAALSWPLRIRLRRGGERLRPVGRRGHHRLKHLLQEAGVPPWRRARLPLVYCGEALVAVPGIAIAAEFAVAEQGQGLVLVWRPEAAIDAGPA